MSTHALHQHVVKTDHGHTEVLDTFVYAPPPLSLCKNELACGGVY